MELFDMRKLLITAVLSLAGVGLTTGQASAWIFRNCCHKKCCTSLCIRAYNAFSPTCFGTMYCDGCFPYAGVSGQGAPPWATYPGAWQGGFCGPAGCMMDGSFAGPIDAGQPDASGQAGLPANLPPTTDAPAAAPAPVQNTVPTMAPAGTPTSQMWVHPLQMAGYRGMAPGYYPGYGVPAVNPMMQGYPGYWAVPGMGR
jgi:hypothetical protein